MSIALPSVRAAVLSPRGFTPKSLSGLVLWLAADRIGGLNDGDPVASWADLSGAGNNATQATASKKPLYKTAIVNGRPIVRFDGVDDTLALVASTAAPKTIVAVARRTATTTYQAVYADLEGVLFASTGTVDGQWGMYGGADRNSGSKLDAFKVATAEVRVIASDTDLVTNGSVVNIAVTTSFAQHPFVGSDDGINHLLTGDVAELVVYSRALSVGERRLVERYLGARYGIAVA